MKVSVALVAIAIGSGGSHVDIYTIPSVERFYLQQDNLTDIWSSIVKFSPILLRDIF